MGGSGSDGMVHVQGASEQYIWSDTSSLHANGGVSFIGSPASLSLVSSSALRRRKSDDDSSPDARRRHSCRTKRLNARIARTSACQSWIATPLASGSLEEGRHFMPVLRGVGQLWGGIFMYSVTVGLRGRKAPSRYLMIVRRKAHKIRTGTEHTQELNKRMNRRRL